jgi:hypothetical protein
MKTYYIGADVHSNSTELAIEHNGKIVRRHSVPTAIPAIKEVLTSVGGKIHLTFEEGPMAGWLYRNLKDTVEEIIVCDPRRNSYIASDGDADDTIDSGKLAALLRGGFLRAVHHSDDEGRAEFKQWVSLYHDRVRDAVRMINKIRARCRMYGIAIPRNVIHDKLQRPQWLAEIQNKTLAAQLEVLWIGYDATALQVQRTKRQLCTLSKREVDRCAITVLRIPCLALLSLDSACGMTPRINRGAFGRAERNGRFDFGFKKSNLKFERSDLRKRIGRHGRIH